MTEHVDHHGHADHAAPAPFRPSRHHLLPDLTPRQELVLLARALHREGYDDHLAGHITCALGDGTLLCNPWFLTWDELRPEHLIRIDVEDGRVVEGDWPAPLGIPLHLAVHRARPATRWVVHNHPLYGTVMADLGVVPPPMDQSSALGGGELVLVDEYDGAVNDPDSAGRVAKAMGDADLALLRGHGVLVLGRSVRAVHQRAVALEQRCQRAWHVRAAGGELVTNLPRSFLDLLQRSDGEGFHGFWEAMARRELRADPTLLDPPPS